MIKFKYWKFQKKKIYVQNIPYCKSKDYRANNVDQMRQLIHYELPHLDLHCLKIHLLSILAIKVLKK